MFSRRSSWLRHSIRLFNFNQHATTTGGRKRFCNSPAQNNNFKNNANSTLRDLEGYRDLDNLNFIKAAKILFSAPPQKKKFGIDFHLVQLFFALMPSLAVYLVAQYARYEMRKMEAELELKKKADEEQKAKEMEAAAAEEKEIVSVDPELSKVKERLEVLEETLKEIVIETKKRPSEEKGKTAHQDEERVDPNSSSDNSHIAAINQPTTQEARPGQPQK